MNHRPDEDKWLDTIRDSMASYETGVPEGVWDEVERRLPVRHRRIMPVWLRRAAVAAMIAGASAVALWLIPGTRPLPELPATAVSRQASPGDAATAPALAASGAESENVSQRPAKRQAAAPTHHSAAKASSATDASLSIPVIQPATDATEAVSPEPDIEEAAEIAAGRTKTPPLPAPAKHGSAARRMAAPAAKRGHRAIGSSSAAPSAERFDMGLSTTGALFASTGRHRSSAVTGIVSSPWSKAVAAPGPASASGSWSAGDGNDDTPGMDYGITGNQGDNGEAGAPGEGIAEGALGPGGGSGINAPIQNLTVPGRDPSPDYDHPVKARHHQPVKVSMAVSYRLTPRLSLESGLTYTCLTSDLEFLPESRFSGATRSLHYLGIPLGVRYRLASWRKLDFYGSASFLTELCVGGRYKKYLKGVTAYTPESVTTDFRERRPQLSANAGLGVQWSITPGVGLYAEPGIGYYFDNGSRVATLYKDHSLNFNINVGFRLTIH